METILRYVIIAAVGALASILANQSIAVFNDGLRPVLPEYLEKRMDRKALAATSFAIGFGLVIGYGLATPGDVWDLYEHVKTATGCMPIGTVLTIAAAGSRLPSSR